MTRTVGLRPAFTIVNALVVVAVLIWAAELHASLLVFNGVQRDGTGDVDGLAAPFSVTVSPDGRNLYAAGSDDDAMAMFTILLFGDTFENGTTSQWSEVVPTD